MTITSRPFAVEVTSGASGLVVRLAGELDLETVSELSARFVGLDANIVVDLADLTFIDATGISGLVSAHERTVKIGRSFALRSPTAQVAKVLSMTGVDQVLTVEP